MSIMRLFSSMTAEQAAPLIKEDLNSFVRSELERALSEALGGGIEDFLLTASSPNGEKIHRNGYYERALKASCGPLSLKVPRDRLALFKTEMLKPYQRATNDLEYLVQTLYLEGLTLSEISDHLMPLKPRMPLSTTYSNKKACDESMPTWKMITIRASTYVKDLGCEEKDYSKSLLPS